jgi:hypothetical protein
LAGIDKEGEMSKRHSRAIGGAAILTAGLALLAGSGLAASAEAPSNKGLPDIHGKLVEGQVLTAATGRWRGSQPIAFKYQWNRCDSSGGSCQNMTGPSNITSYTLTHDDVGRRLILIVTATNADGTASASSRPTDVIRAAAAQAPVNNGPPTISGNLQQGSTLTASTGTWTGEQPISFASSWQRCDAKGGGCGDTPVHGQTYSLSSSDVGHTLRIVVTAKNPAGSAAATSAPTGVIAGPSSPPPPPPPGTCKPVSAISLPDQLLVDRIQFDPARITTQSQPLIARFHISTTRGECVSGALVYAVGVPFDRLSNAPEVPSGGDGWATITFRILPTFQLRKGNLVVVFVRARKPGDSLLAGVSTRRLVSVRVG